MYPSYFFPILWQGSPTAPHLWDSVALWDFLESVGTWVVLESRSFCKSIELTHHPSRDWLACCCCLVLATVSSTNLALMILGLIRLGEAFWKQ